MNNKEKVLRLLYFALLDIRAAANDDNAKVCFVLSDITHNIPLQILRAESQNGDYQEIMDWIHMRCKQMKIESWLDNVLSQL